MTVKKLSQQPEQVEMWINKGLVCGKLGKYAEAMDSYDRAEQLKPTEDRIFSYRGFLNLTLKNNAAAKKDFLRALEINPKNIHAQQYLKYC